MWRHWYKTPKYPCVLVAGVVKTDSHCKINARFSLEHLKWFNPQFLSWLVCMEFDMDRDYTVNAWEKWKSWLISLCWLQRPWWPTLKRTLLSVGVLLPCMSIGFVLAGWVVDVPTFLFKAAFIEATGKVRTSRMPPWQHLGGENQCLPNKVKC